MVDRLVESVNSYEIYYVWPICTLAMTTRTIEVAEQGFNIDLDGMDLLLHQNKQEAFKSIRPESMKLKELTHGALNKFIGAQVHLAFVSFPNVQFQSCLI